MARALRKLSNIYLCVIYYYSIFNSILVDPELTCLRCVLFTYQCKRLLLYSTGCFTLMQCLYKKYTETFIKYYMTNSLSIKQINHFICVSVIISKFKDKCKHIFTLVNDKFQNKLVKNSGPEQRLSSISNKNARVISCPCRQDMFVSSIHSQLFLSLLFLAKIYC